MVPVTERVAKGVVEAMENLVVVGLKKRVEVAWKAPLSLYWIWVLVPAGESMTVQLLSPGEQDGFKVSPGV
jgi:hypothetical protein